MEIVKSKAQLLVLADEINIWYRRGYNDESPYKLKIIHFFDGDFEYESEMVKYVEVCEWAKIEKPFDLEIKEGGLYYANIEVDGAPIDSEYSDAVVKILEEYKPQPYIKE